MSSKWNNLLGKGGFFLQFDDYSVRKAMTELLEKWMQNLDGQERKVDDGAAYTEENNILPIIKNQKITLCTREVSELLGVSIDTIYSLVRESKIPCLRLRRKYLFNRESIEIWIKSGGAVFPK